MRQQMHLNNDWKYIENFDEAYINNDFDDSHFKNVRLPHANIELPYNNFDERSYQFISCYRRKIVVAKEHEGKRAVIHFEGVMTYAKVYVNGQFICEHFGGYTPFEADITAFVNYDTENTLVVMVDSTERSDIPPFGHTVDYLTYGGIYREVHLEFRNALTIENMFVKTRELHSDRKLLEIEVFIENRLRFQGEYTLMFTFGDNTKVMEKFQVNITLNGSQSEKFILKQHVSGVELWDTANPKLYQLKVVLEKDHLPQDAFDVRFGFRSVAFKRDGFYLNGNKIKLMGLNRHQSYPHVGYAMPASAQIKDAEILKDELGVNIVRLSHYPQSRHFLDRCDEIGLLVFEEIPGWQHIGDKEWKKIALKNVEEMIKRDWNRPSVIIWGVRINESQDDDVFYEETNALAHSLDDTRPTGGVRNFENSNFLEDVYTYNDFIHRGNNPALHVPEKITKKKVPILITEHNGHMYPTKKFDNESKRVEHALRHARVLNTMYKDDVISGAIGWCMFDYNTHKEFGNGDKICYHGVMDMFRIPKEAASVYASQLLKSPIMEVLSSMERGEMDASEVGKAYIFTNCDKIELLRNGDPIGTFYPDRTTFGALPHPPVIIDDFIGNMIERHEKFNQKDAATIKELMLAIIKYGDKTLPIKYKVKLGLTMLKLKLSYKDTVKLYDKYVANWGCESLEYTFVGYMGEQPVLSVKKGPGYSVDLSVVPDKLILEEKETYDVCRIVIKNISQLGNILHYASDSIHIDVEGPCEVIGPSDIALIGGSTGFWIRSIGQAGDITIRISSSRFETKEVKMKAIVN